VNQFDFDQFIKLQTVLDDEKIKSRVHLNLRRWELRVHIMLAENRMICLRNLIIPQLLWSLSVIMYALKRLF